MFDFTGFDPSAALPTMLRNGHSHWLGLSFGDSGRDWVELVLPWRADLVGESGGETLASGPIVSLMDMAAGMSIATACGRFVPIATLDLRVDYTRPARARASVTGRVECYRLTRSAAFVRGLAHDGDPDDPVAHVAGAFMRFEQARYG
ncbi:MAG: PaaI family thioesterase [Tsuneonella sp.]